MALGALHTVHQAGLKVPQDMSIAGFDDIRFSRFSIPALTTVHQPAEQIGREVVRLLVGLLRGEEDVSRSVTPPHEIIVRASTGPCPSEAA